MIGRWFFIAVVGIALFTWVQAPNSRAHAGAVTQSCSAAVPGAATITFAWPSPEGGAVQTWVDISLAPGFAPGWFKGHGPLAGSQTVYALDGVPQGLNFFYRVNTLYSSGWKETASGSFVSNCGGAGGSGPPATVDVVQKCDSSGNVTVMFKWQANAPGQQWLDLSTMNNGFAPGTFVGAGPVASGSGTYTWSGIAKGLTHYWRVNALTPAGWSSSNTGSFTSLSCLPPLKACIGFMAGLSSEGRGECDQVIGGSDANLSLCVKYILGKSVIDGPGACARVKINVNVDDCLLGLSGQSYWGRTSCRVYYQS